MNQLCATSNSSLLSNKEYQYHLKSGLLSGCTAGSMTALGNIWLPVLAITPSTPFSLSSLFALTFVIPELATTSFCFLDHVQESKSAKEVTFYPFAPLLGSVIGNGQLWYEALKGQTLFNCYKSSLKTSFWWGATLGTMASIFSSPNIHQTASFVEQFIKRRNADY